MSENHLFGAIRAAMPALDTPLATLADGRVETYGDALALSARLAHLLVARGVKPGDRVAVQVEKSWPALALYLATVRAGGVYLPLNTAYTLNEVEYFLSDAEPTLFICPPHIEAEARALTTRLGVPSIETLGADGTGSLTDGSAHLPTEFADVLRGPEDLGGILYTSGTTGRAKGAMLSHDNLLSNALTLKDEWRFTGDDVLLHALPIFHTHGLFVASNIVLLAGAAMIFRAKFDPREALELMAAGEVTSLMGVPTFYTRLLDQPGLTKEATAKMRLFVSGSAPLLAETHRAFFERTGHAILERYGMTETGMNTSNPYDGERIAGTVGFPLPGISLRVTDPESGRVLPTDDIGMIEVKGPNVFKGYWRMPEKTAAEFRDGYFITGDLGKIDAKGYVHIVGRGKDLVITGGFNVYPKEVEGEIDAIPGVAESAVIGVPHPDFGEGVTAVVVPVAGASLTEADINAALENRLAKFKQPKRVFFVAELPRNTMGKVQKNVLRDTYKDIFRAVA
ncbi:UNVERIFIED_ORG: malonyl-CoA/methylmalonyl-CoA synthetase [Xanthobacter viscosus]|jgi:malonyl-CoA/methylmalonyl-CoA synthetase|uniref:Malonyl-CoA synthase n=1 Tax=Xanthobacter autotrophicus TaxID=280 RepID=A0A6C1KJ23_XANAU|nr:malonyl-CoA synthase [Xanthobacter autotrophicus]TLX44195.1 malonyl-CoA synthase [Xanthobacter autotrophicus]